MVTICRGHPYDFNDFVSSNYVIIKVIISSRPIPFLNG